MGHASIDLAVVGCCGANLASLQFALQRLGVTPVITNDPVRIRSASHVILPGVGAARAAMARLQATGLAALLPTLAQPVLGICLGMQLLTTRSEEENTACLDIIKTQVLRFPESAGLAVPHMGWNQLTPAPDSSLFAGIAAGGYAYFVHSYRVPVRTCTLATTEYVGPFSAAIGRANFFGTQFHPERSSTTGARILANFLDL